MKPTDGHRRTSIDGALCTSAFVGGCGAVCAAQAAVVPSSPTVVNPEFLAGAGAVVITVLLALLYFYRRRLYILYWIGGWSLVAVSMFVGARHYASAKVASVAFGASQFVGIVSSLLFVVSADAYRGRPRLRREYGVLLLALLIWFTLAPAALGVEAAFAPGHLLTAGGLAAAGAAHLMLLRQARLLGAALVGATLILIAATHVWTAVALGSPADPRTARALLITLVLYLVTALGMQLLTFEDMTYELRRTNRNLEAAQSELRQMVITDPLTGCRNRRFFDEVIEREMQRHHRYNQPLSILFIDVDRFKAINDTLGHEAGDTVLRRVAGFLVRNVREADYVFRWGGDEFLILITCREDEARRRGRALQAAFATPEHTEGLPRGVGLSVGCVEVPPETPDVMAYVKVADQRMYENKRGTR